MFTHYLNSPHPTSSASPPAAAWTTARAPSSGACSTTPSSSSRTRWKTSSARPTSPAAGTINLANLTDGLRAEREQGITIDVAYRYFATPRRKFIVADTPGHVQYTRNMVTGASTANLAIILVDARQGVVSRPSATPTSPPCSASRSPGRVREQDGPGRLVRGGLRPHQGRLPRLRHPTSTSRTSPSSRSAPCTATTLWKNPDRMPPGTWARRCCATWRRSTSPPTMT
jgi:hypothetical protein